ncbi:hypothetical protein [Halarchaeum salinum]|uniref:Uncharacterized protein n=1 Tax=Halarchaeum salinum TaxID=489912 RepID=A0AAV3S4C0_9EURY
MTDSMDEDVSVAESKRRQVRERVLQAEKEKLHLDLARGINDDIEEIIREEID